MLAAVAAYDGMNAFYYPNLFDCTMKNGLASVLPAPKLLLIPLNPPIYKLPNPVLSYYPIVFIEFIVRLLLINGKPGEVENDYRFIKFCAVVAALVAEVVLAAF